jgi:hypothetical protein
VSGLAFDERVQSGALGARLRNVHPPLLDQPAGLLDLRRERGAHLVEEVVDLLLVDADLVRQRHRLRVVDHVVQPVDQLEDVHARHDRRITASSSQ